VRLLIVVPRQDRATGNWVTATRLQQGLTGRGHTVLVTETAGDSLQLQAAVAAAMPDLALLLHAWRSGRPWLASGCSQPYAVLLTGTDINFGITDPLQAPVIDEVLQRAAAIISQNPLTVAELRREHPELATRVCYLPPGITLGSTPWPWREGLDAAPGELLCLCPAGIRPVKGVLELIGLCEPLVSEGHSLRLAFCGPILDDDYGRRFLDAVTAHPWTHYLGVVPPAAMPAALRQADIILSNSFGEGLPNALVEATAVGRPILARDIPGNAAVVIEGDNGLLFHDEHGFCGALRRLCDDPALRAFLSRPDPERFSNKHEASTLETLCRRILAAFAAITPRQV
jgi:hypothetical protein